LIAIIDENEKISRESMEIHEEIALGVERDYKTM